MSARRHRRGGPTGDAAFTLLEVMVAVAILALALLSIGEITSASLRSQVLARDLDVATLLARGKMAELTERYEREGFTLGGGEDEGTFEEEGHPSIRWRAKLLEPPGNLDAKGLAGALIGDAGGLEGLFAPRADTEGRQQVNPAAAAMSALVEQQLQAFAEKVKQGVRELRLTVTWSEGAATEAFTVRTLLVVMQPSEGAR